MAAGVRTARAPGKINLGLRVLRRRPDGYHDLDTVFYPIAWADTLQVQAAARLVLRCDAPGIPVDETNLVMRAARALAQETSTQRGADIELIKHLPAGAGLGGGSSDAAATLRLLADLWQTRTPKTVLQRLALAMGSDVPFFLNSKPARASGRGEVLELMAEYVMPFALVVVVPRLHVSTAWAFSKVKPRASHSSSLCAAVVSNDLGRWRRELVNDFEGPVMAALPEIRTRKEALMTLGAGFASLTGTGSAVYGMFEDVRHARAAAAEAQEAGCIVYMELGATPQV